LLTKTKRKIVENASGAAMRCEGSAESPRQVDVSRKRSATSCFAVAANKIGGEGHTRQRRRTTWLERPTIAPPHNTILTLCYRTTVDHWLAGGVVGIMLEVDIELGARTCADNGETGNCEMSHAVERLVRHYPTAG
jgi:hypothetical protein